MRGLAALRQENDDGLDCVAVAGVGRVLVVVEVEVRWRGLRQVGKRRVYVSTKQ